MRKGLILIGLLGLAATAAVAQDDVVGERQDLMKSNRDAMRELVPMARGERAFDAEAALAALEKLQRDADAMDAERLYPEGSDAGADTEAAPTIWSDRDGFVAAIDKFRTDTAAGVAAAPQDAASLGQALGPIGQNCQSCHETYRIDKG